MSSAPAAKLIPGVLGGFVSAYGMWAVLTKDAKQKLPHTIQNPEWLKATNASYEAFPRHASDVPVVMNPGRLM
ncbi:hypothetical protein C2E20_7568 [Micractinium conductrix]|uniref:Uncharacterized protein n=1 Tax=Micractinium conductrix TaxID=554055 RepID=A0A2P6V4B1_9CHLO|nr:hypothetical protein C2E20_7568 [Micractinium conductrix]|eukprot:PSC68909.1 hypothetical protein C2E20_7568 [Micractinium conductrix]